MLLGSIAITGHYRVISMPGCAAKAYANYSLKIEPHVSCVCLCDSEGRFHSYMAVLVRSILHARQTLQIQSSNILRCIYIYIFFFSIYSYFYSYRCKAFDRALFLFNQSCRKSNIFERKWKIHNNYPLHKILEQGFLCNILFRELKTL